MNDDVALRTQIRALADHSEILECLYRYTRGMDRHDRELARSAYHDGAIDVHGSQAFLVEDFLDWALAYHEQQLHHQHYLSNVTIEVEGDTAHTESYYWFVGRYPERETPLTMAGGRYIDRFEHKNGRWAIATRVCTAEWRTTPPSKLPDRGTPTIVQQLFTSHDFTDASYVRPLEVQLLRAAE